MTRSVYAKIQDLRDEGLSVTDFPDAAAYRMLRNASATVEHLTGQLFAPHKKTIRQDGRGGRLVYEESNNKIIELIPPINLVDSEGSKYEVDSYNYAAKERAIKIRRGIFGHPSEQAIFNFREVRWPDKVKNIEFTCIFGWIDKISTKIETTLSADLTTTDTTISLTERTGIEEDHIILINETFWVISKQGSQTGTGTITIDACGNSATSGDKVVVYGKVPFKLREAVIRTAIANRFGLASAEYQQQQLTSIIKEERTDNYRYQLFAPAGGVSGNRSASRFSGTGDPIADAILSQFRAPLTGMWV